MIHLLNKQNKLLPYQAFFVLIHAQIGIGVISMPYDVFIHAKADSWISIIVTGLVIQCVIFLIMYIMGKYPNESFFQVLQTMFGKWLARFILFAYFLYFIALCSLLLARYAVILSTWMMPLTPKWITVLLMICIIMYGVSTKLQVMARFFLLASFVFLIFIGFSIYAWKDGTWTFLSPIGNSGLKRTASGIYPAFSAFQGYETLLFLYPFIQGDGRTKLKVATFANIFVTLFYTFIMLTTIVFLSEAEIKLTPEPVLYVVKSFAFKIIERPDLLFTAIWIVLVATTIMIVFFNADLIVRHLTTEERSNRSLYILGVIVFLLSLIPNGIYEVNDWMAKFQPVILIFAIGLPIIYASIALLTKRKGEKQ